MAFTDRLKAARLERGLTQEQLAHKIGVAKSTYTGYEKGNSEPNMLTLSRIMESLNVDANYLFQDETSVMHSVRATRDEMERLVQKYRDLDAYGKGTVDLVLNREYRRVKCEKALHIQSEASVSHEEKTYYVIGGFYQPMSAGLGVEARDSEPEDFTLVKQPPRGASYLAPVSGDSMEPTFHDGDKLFIQTCTDIEPGRIGVFFMDGMQWVKELGDGVLISHNPKYPPIPMTEDIRCQGLVLGVCDPSYFG